MTTLEHELTLSKSVVRVGYRAGFVGLVGLPNSGKSTLMNALVGEKVSIVTAKPQTTRRRIVGLVSTQDYQAIVVDAPGLVDAPHGLNRFLRDETRDVMAQSDLLIAVLSIDEEEFAPLEQMIELVTAAGKPWLAVINKIDLSPVRRIRILEEKLGGVDIVHGSSLKNPGELRDAILPWLSRHLPPSPLPLYDEEIYTLSPMRELCAELVREKCFEYLHQEIPFNLAVKTVKFDEDSGPVLRIYVEIWVAKENHRPIVIGHEGQRLKQIATEARRAIEKVAGRKVYLAVNVLYKPNWPRQPTLMQQLGYFVQQDSDGVS